MQRPQRSLTPITKLLPNRIHNFRIICNLPVLQHSRVWSYGLGLRGKGACYDDSSGRGAAAKTARKVPAITGGALKGFVAEIGAADSVAIGWGRELNLRHCHSG